MKWSEIDKILISGEKILWQGRPYFWSFILGSLGISIFGIFWLLFLVPFIKAMGKGVLFLPHFWIGVFLTFWTPVYTMLVWRYVHYAITDRRIIIQKGLIGRDFHTLEYDKIQDVYVNVGLWDKIFGTGDIVFHTAGGAYAATQTFPGQRVTPRTAPSLSDIHNPYEVFRLLEKLRTEFATRVRIVRTPKTPFTTPPFSA